MSNQKNERVKQMRGKAGAGLSEPERTLAALLAANEELRSKNASLQGIIDAHRVEVKREALSSRAWMLVAVAADGGRSIYGAAHAEALKAVKAGGHFMSGGVMTAVREMYAAEQLNAAQELTERLRRLAVPYVLPKSEEGDKQ